MNNRYLFRGKRFDNGEWVIGFLSYVDERHGLVMITEVMAAENCISEISYHVIPETIGQCTGLKDRNGALIFEGDIINFRANYCSRGRNGYHDGVIVWAELYDHCYSGWMIKVDGFEEWFDMGEETEEFYCKAEVIGNIHDEKELNK